MVIEPADGEKFMDRVRDNLNVPINDEVVEYMKRKNRARVRASKMRKSKSPK